MLIELFDYYLFGFKESDNLWWDAFATEFFEDDATLTLSFSMEDGPKRYSKLICCVIAFRVLYYFGIWICEFLARKMETIYALCMDEFVCIWQSVDIECRYLDVFHLCIQQLVVA